MVVEVVEDKGELAIQFTPEQLDQLGWTVGDEIVWTVLDGQITLFRRDT